MRENEKVVRENNQLHQELIATKERAQLQERELMVSVRQIESERNDIMFLND